MLACLQNSQTWSQGGGEICYCSNPEGDDRRVIGSDVWESFADNQSRLLLLLSTAVNRTQLFKLFPKLASVNQPAVTPVPVTPLAATTPTIPQSPIFGWSPSEGFLSPTLTYAPSGSDSGSESESELSPWESPAWASTPPARIEAKPKFVLTPDEDTTAEEMLKELGELEMEYIHLIPVDEVPAEACLETAKSLLLSRKPKARIAGEYCNHISYGTPLRHGDMGSQLTHISQSRVPRLEVRPAAAHLSSFRRKGPNRLRESAVDKHRLQDSGQCFIHHQNENAQLTAQHLYSYWTTVASLMRTEQHQKK